MFIGLIGQTRVYPSSSNIRLLGMQANIFTNSKQESSLQRDCVEIGIYTQQNNEMGIYKRNGNQMQAFSPISYTKIAPDESLKKELLPPSEQSFYTEEDALMNQYMKQYRIDGYFDGDTFVQNSSEPVKLVLKDQISKEDLESFRNELIEKGLGTEIDWCGVKSDFIGMSMGFDNIENFQKKADYVASRYAVLKDRIQTQFMGDKQKAELQKLEQIYAKAKEEMANSFAENIGGFYENLGQSDVVEDMRNSVLAVIEDKTEAYIKYIAQNDIYANITESDKQWLKQDDGYMAAQLRESISGTQQKKHTETISTKAPYSEKDLAYAGMYAKELSWQLKEPQWDTFTVKRNDSDLGKYLAEQYKTIFRNIENAGISNKLSDMLKNSFEPFIDKFMDTLDTKINQNRERVAVNPQELGLIRTNYIDRDSVYNAFQNAIFGM